MTTIKQAIDTVQKNLQIYIMEKGAEDRSDHDYYVYDEKFISLGLSELHFENFDALQPVFEIVKTFHFYNCTFNADTIVEDFKRFTALETILVHVNSVESAQVFLQLEMIKVLELYIDYEIIKTNTLLLDFKGLKSIKQIILSCDNIDSDKMIVFKGAEYLTTLKTLILLCDCIVEDLNKFKNLKYLETKSIHLQVTHGAESITTLDINLHCKEDFNIYSLEQFPNLENLMINGECKINLGTLNKLKVLCISSGKFESQNDTIFDGLPNLEQLEFFNTNFSSETKNIGKLSNLKVLNISENNGLENINWIESLKNLEYINLYQNKISNISVLNKLPKLKEVNVACNNITQEDVDQQLEKPELARFLFLPHAPEVAFNIWGKVCEEFDM